MERTFIGPRSLGRRALIAVLGGAAVWPLAAYAQQPEGIRRVGVLMGFPENDPFAQRIVSAFSDALRQGLGPSTRRSWENGLNY